MTAAVAMNALGVEPRVQVPCGVGDTWQGAENERKIRGLGRSCNILHNFGVGIPPACSSNVLGRWPYNVTIRIRC
jgi:hypothetical protein